MITGKILNFSKPYYHILNQEVHSNYLTGKLLCLNESIHVECIEHRLANIKGIVIVAKQMNETQLVALEHVSSSF